MKMTKIGMISSNGATTIIFSYTIITISAMVLTFENFNLMVCVGLGIVVLMIIHLAINSRVRELRFFHRVSDPIFVADWGPYGRIKSTTLLPAGIRENVFFTSASNVRDKVEEIEQKLIESGNKMFKPENGKKGIEVKAIFFARGEHVEERWNPKAYKKRLFNTVAKDIVEFHTIADRADPDSGFSKSAYEEIYIDTHLNGSVY